MDLEEQYDKLLRYCYMKLRDRALAEDITQEALTRFLESGRGRNMGRETAYLYTIARNLCADHFRTRRETLLDDLPPQAQDALLQCGKEREIVERIAMEEALDRLNADEREAVVLRFSVGLSVGDIGKTMALSRFAVRRRLSSALAKLRKEMEQER